MNSFDDESSASSSSPSSSSSSDHHFLSSTHNTKECCSSPPPASTDPHYHHQQQQQQQQRGDHGGGVYVKRKAGRKKFRETRHPVYRGVRERNGGKWVCEVREPHKKTRIWLGTYVTPEMAARAHDVAAIALRGKSAPLNFADSAWVLPRARSSAADDIRAAAVQAAEMFRPASGSGSPGSCSPSPSQRQRIRVPAVSPVSSSSSSSAVAAPAMVPAPAPVSFVDEEALFNMPALLHSMAEGMMLTPPMSMVVPHQQQQYNEHVDWDEVDDGEGGLHMDLSLWTH